MADCSLPVIDRRSELHLVPLFGQSLHLAHLSVIAFGRRSADAAAVWQYPRRLLAIRFHQMKHQRSSLIAASVGDR